MPDLGTLIASTPDGGTLQLDRGVYTLGEPLTVNRRIRLLGCGPADTLIQLNYPAGDGLILGGEHSVVREIGFAGGPQRTAGTSIRLLPSASFSRLDMIDITGAMVGIAVQATRTVVERANIRDGAPGASVAIEVSQTPYAVHISDVVTDNPAGHMAVGIAVYGVGDIQLDRCSIIRSGISLHVHPNPGEVAASVWATSCLFDTADYGIVLGAQDAAIVRAKFDGCWTSSHSQHGILLYTTGTGRIERADFNGTHSLFNSQCGLAVSGPNISFLRIAGQFAANGNTGVLLDGGTQVSADIQADGNNHGLLASSAVHSLAISPTSHILGNRTANIINQST